MIAIHVQVSGRPVLVYVLDLRQCLDCCSAFRRAGAKVLLIRANSPLPVGVAHG